MKNYLECSQCQNITFEQVFLLKVKNKLERPVPGLPVVQTATGEEYYMIPAVCCNACKHIVESTKPKDL